MMNLTKNPKNGMKNMINMLTDDKCRLFLDDSSLASRFLIALKLIIL